MKERNMAILNMENKLAKEDKKLVARKTYLLDKEVNNIKSEKKNLQKKNTKIQKIQQKDLKHWKQKVLTLSQRMSNQYPFPAHG